MRAPVVLALLLASLALPGCADGPGAHEPLPEHWRGRDLREPGWINETVPAGWTLAFEYEWSGGTRIAWDWVSLDQQFIHFQVVRMENGRVVRPPMHWTDGLDDEGQATVVQGGVHHLDFISQSSKPTPLAVKVPAGYKEVLYPPGKGPDCTTGRIC